MKKIFRMQYEPCLGTCYEYDDILMEEFRKLRTQPDKLKSLLEDLNFIHEKSCGNSTLGFILDYDEQTFIGSFLYDGMSHAFVGKNINEVYSKFKDLINLYYLDNPETEVHKHECDHGRDDNIISWTLDKANIVGLYDQN